MGAPRLKIATPNPRLFPSRAKVYAYVRPRFSCGSPAMVTDGLEKLVQDLERPSS